MLNKILRFFLYFLAFILVLGVFTLKIVDRTPIQDQEHYTTMMSTLASLKLESQKAMPLAVGTARVSITPDSVMPLAGYGARRPKEFDNLLDSVFIRTIVIETEKKKAALLSADLLIIHPKMTQALHRKLEEIGWDKNDVFLMATHTHSSIGQWAPGLVGGLFAGDYDHSVAEIIADKMIKSLIAASKKLEPAKIGYSSAKNLDLVHNRLVGEKGIEDPFQKNIFFETASGTILFSAFSAHATCLGHGSRSLSGDFPGHFHQAIAHDSSFIFSLYAAGPVASMGPEAPRMDQYERVKFLGNEIANRVNAPVTFDDSISITAFRVSVQLGTPQFKISKDIALRAYLFDYAFGDEPADISVLKLGNTLIIGTPCDFSGELAVPLYGFAKEKGFELIMTSFNGGYIGYITKDDWYDLEKYETRTMNWYGPGNGAYFTEIIKRIITSLHENN